MEGFPRERAPDPQDPAGGPSGDGLRWQEVADAAWIAAARVAAAAPPAGSAGAAPPRSRGGSGPGGDQRPQEPPGDAPDAAPPAQPPSPGEGGGFGVPSAALYLVDAGAAGEAAADPAGEAVPVLGPGIRPGRMPGPPSRGRTAPARLAKALHGLARAAPSRWKTELDEDRTARQGLSDNLWIPCLRPAAEKAFDLLVLADDAVTMRVWDETVAVIAVEAVRSGAFRDVRTVRLALPPRTAGGARLRWAGGRAGDPAELIDARGARVFLVVTDGLAHGWAGPAADGLLKLLARSGPTALVHLLPTFLWHRSTVDPYRVSLAAAGFGAPNDRMRHEAPRGGPDPLRPLPRTADAAVPVPVLSLKAESFTAWAALAAGERGVRRTLPAVLAGTMAAATPAPGLRTPRVTGPRAAAAAVSRFLSLATPTARRLATDLAAVPFEFGVIEEMRRRTAPEAGPAHVSEIMMGGLIDWGADRESRPDFADGIREALLATGTRTRLARVVNVFADIPSGGERGTRLRAAIRDPENADLPEVTPADEPWLRTELAVLKALSGPYARRAARLAGAMAGSTDGHISVTGGSGPPSGGIWVQDADAPGDRVPLTTPDSPDTQAPEAAHTMELDATQARHVRPDQPKIMGNIPPKNPNFTGRESLLAAVEERLRGEETAAVLPHALHGMGGVGKSQLAIEYVYRHSHEYNVIWWVPAERDSSVLAALVDLARSLGLDVGPQANTAVPAVREALRTGRPYDNWLLVFDNAEDIEAVRAYFPTGGPGKIIVTSRNRDWERVATPLTVNVFERGESIALLRRRARDLSTEDADRLAEALGDLPLAIEQAGAWHAATGMPVAEYLDLLAQRRPGILELDPSPDYPVSVAAAWNISLEELAASNPAALQLLQICACMAPEPIPLGMLRSTRNVEITPELDPVLRDPVRLARATRDLSKLSLIRLDHKNGTLQMHRLMQTVLAVGLSPAQSDAMHHAACVLLAAAKPGAPEAPEQWPAYQVLLPHIVASGAVRSSDPWVRELVQGSVLYLYYWGAHEAAANLAREAWTAWLAQSGEEDLKVLQMSKLLAYMLRLLGRAEEAFTLNDAALEISRRSGVPDEELIDSMSQMSQALRTKGDFYAARALDVEADGRARDLFGPEDPATLLAAHSLGVTLRGCGEFAKARELDAETARQWELLYGPTNGLTLNTMNGLAIDVREAGDYRSARAMQEETYLVHVNAFGVDNAATIRAARNLAVCRRRDGDLEGAGTLAEETLRRFAVRYGDDYPDTLAAAMNAAVDRRLRGDLTGSRELGERTLALYRAAMGETHAYTLSAMVNLAATLRAMGEIDAAEALDTASLDRFRETLGSRHVSTLTAAMGLAGNHYSRLDFAAARGVDAATLPDLGEACGPDHPVTLACRANLALDLRGLGRTEEADELGAAAVAGFARSLGAEHPWSTAARLYQRIEVDIAPMPL